MVLPKNFDDNKVETLPKLRGKVSLLLYNLKGVIMTVVMMIMMMVVIIVMHKRRRGKKRKL